MEFDEELYEEETSLFDPDTEMGYIESSLSDNDERKLNIIRYYSEEKHIQYLSGMSSAMKMIRYFELHKEKTYNVVKTTRAGFTTNCILASMILNKKILLIAPTNKILYDTVMKAYDLYIEITGDYKKLIRPIPNNKQGCSCVVKKLKENPELDILPFLSSEDCENCTNYESFKLALPKFVIMSTEKKCITKTLLDEKDYFKNDYKIDVITITLDKLMTLGNSKKGKFFKNIIDEVDIIVFDEIGDYVSKTSNPIEFGKTISYKNITESYDPEIYLYDLANKIGLIKNKRNKIILSEIYDKYISPFFNELILPLSKSNKTYPRIEINPLTKYMVIEDVPLTAHITKEMKIGMQELLKKKNKFYYKLLENMLKDGEKPEFIMTMIELLSIMTSTQILFYKTNTVNYKGNLKTKVETLNAKPTKDSLVNFLNEWTKDKNKISIFSDATMPIFKFKGYNVKKIKNIFYGDPAKTNKKMLVFHDDKNIHFSKLAWFDSPKFRDSIFKRILEAIHTKFLGNIVIWCPSKDVAKSLNHMLINKGIDTCSPDNPDNKKLIITYYGSTFTRGVSSDRRYQILLGKASKPKTAYEHIAFLQRDDWNLLNERDMSIMANEQNLSLNEFSEKLKKWAKIIETNGFIFMKNEIPDIFIPFFNLLTMAISKEKMYMDTWQAASRAKDPTAKINSCVLCLGWTLNEVKELTRWGSNESVSYSPISEKRLLKTQKNAISLPYIFSSSDFQIIQNWLNGMPIPEQYLGFNDDIIEGIKELTTERKKISTKEIWLEFCNKNVSFDNHSDRENNGYLIGSLNLAFMRSFGDCIRPYKHNPGDFEFVFDNEYEEELPDFYLEDNEWKSSIDILRSIYLYDNSVVKKADIRNNISTKKISNDLFNELWELFEYYNIFDGSTWSISGNTIHKKTSDDVSHHELIKIVDDSFKKDSSAHILMKYLVHWYYLEKDIFEVTVNHLTEVISSFSNNHVNLYHFLKNMINSPKWEILKNFGMLCDVDITTSEIHITRKLNI